MSVPLIMRRCLSLRIALRPDAYTPLRSRATTTMSHARHSLASAPPSGGDLKGPWFSVATVAGSILALTTISSVGAEPATLIIDSTQPTIVAELPQSSSPPSTSPTKPSQNGTRNTTQEVLGALCEPSPSGPSRDTVDDSKSPESTPPPPPAGAMQYERPRRRRERAALIEEDVCLAGGSPDEPAQEFLPPPYRRY